jgi:hypothetical protein
MSFPFGTPPTRRDDHFDLRITLSPRAVAFLVVVVSIVARLVETVAVRLIIPGC